MLEQEAEGAALTIAMVPVVVVYLIFYRQVQAGLTGATLK